MPNSTTAPVADHEGERFSTEIRPGVNFPDWTAITSAQARSALNDIIRAFGIDRCWRDYSPDEDLCRRTILQAYLDQGRPPTISQLSARLGRSANAVGQILLSLKRRDLVLFDEQTASIQGTYPLCERETEHSVRLGDIVVHAMCAIDALGTGRMYRRDAVIESRCRATMAPIRIATTDLGRSLGAVAPAQAVVWSGIRATEGCAADTLCPLMAFFADDTALEDWRTKEHPTVPGYRLSIAEAMETGMAIFGPMLAEANA